MRTVTTAISPKPMASSVSPRLLPSSSEETTVIREITEVPEESIPPLRHGSSRIPSSVNLDGIDWFLTVVLVTVDALLLALHQTGTTRWATLVTWVIDPHFDEDWLGKFEETFFLLAVAVVNVFILVPILNINIRTPSRNSWRFWLLSAWASLCLLNIIAAMQFTCAVSKAIDNEGVDYWVSYFFLVSMVVICTIMIDIRFVMLYGVFSCLTCNASATLEYWNGLRSIIGMKPKTDRMRWRDVLNIRKIVARSIYGNERHRWHEQRSTTHKFVQKAQEGVSRFIRRRRLRNMRHLLSTRVTQDLTDMPSEDVEDYLDQIMQSQSSFYFNVVKQKVMAFWDSISEEPGIFEYSSWMKAAVSFTILMLMYNCIKAIEVIFSIDASWDVTHNAAVQLQSGMATFHRVADDTRRSLHQISELADEAEITDSVQAVYHQLQDSMHHLDEAVLSFLPEGMTNSTSYRRATSMMHLALFRMQNMMHDSHFDRHKIIAGFFYIDSLIRWLKYACCVGYPIGTLIGLYSLVQVMRQHKDMSMALAREEHVRSRMMLGRMGHPTASIDGVFGLEKKYPIGGAVYFIGVLTSTAIVQQHAFGFVITLMTGIMLNIDKIDVLLDFGGYVVLIYIIIIIVNFVCSHVIGDRLLTQHGFKIRYPQLFFLFLFVFTIVHAVLGFFYALWRALLLFLTSVWVINRLDVSLFQTGKKWDNGHYSFMSMLLLTHVIRLENEARNEPMRGGSQSNASELPSVASEMS